MKTTSGALTTFLENTTQFVRADLYSFALNGGTTVLRYCSCSIPIRAAIYVAGTLTGPFTWNVGPPIEDQGVQSARGTGGASVDINIYGGNSEFLVGGVDILDFLENFGLDGASARIDRVFAADWSAMFTSGPVGGFCRFSGLVSEVKELGQTQAVVTVKSPMALLATPFPADVFQTSCLNVFGDSNCGVDIAPLTVTGAVSTGSVTATQTVFGSNLTQADSYFTLGDVTFTSGANAGESRSAKSYLNSHGEITLTSPLPAAPANGDTFTVSPGCSLALSSTDPNGCQQWQPSTWQTRFRATPWVPPPTTGLPT